MTRAPWVSLPWIIIPPVPLLLSSHVIISVDGFLPFAVNGRSRSSTSVLAAVMMPSLKKKKKKEKRPHAALLVPPTLSFSQFPATPLGSWVLSEKLFFTQPHRCQPIGGLWSRCHVMVCSQSQTPTTAHFLEGKYIHRAWMFLFLISSAGKKKRKAKRPLLQQCLNITRSVCVTLSAQCRDQVNKEHGQHQHVYVASTHGGPATSAHAAARAAMCTYARRPRNILICIDSCTHAWILVERFNASHSFRLEPLPLCSYHSISLNCSVVTPMTRRLPFWELSVTFRLHPLNHGTKWGLIIKVRTTRVQQTLVIGLRAKAWKQKHVDGPLNDQRDRMQLCKDWNNHAKIMAPFKKWGQRKIQKAENERERERGRGGKEEERAGLWEETRVCRQGLRLSVCWGLSSEVDDALGEQLRCRAFRLHHYCSPSSSSSNDARTQARTRPSNTHRSTCAALINMQQRRRKKEKSDCCISALASAPLWSGFACLVGQRNRTKSDFHMLMVNLAACTVVLKPLWKQSDEKSWKKKKKQLWSQRDDSFSMRCCMLGEFGGREQRQRQMKSEEGADWRTEPNGIVGPQGPLHPLFLL